MSADAPQSDESSSSEAPPPREPTPTPAPPVEESTGERATGAFVLDAIDELLVEDGEHDLFAEELAPATDPRERRAVGFWFGLTIAVILTLALSLGLLPGLHKRSLLKERYHDALRENGRLRQEIADLRRQHRRLDERDPYLIERLARDSLLLRDPGERRLLAPPPTAGDPGER